MAESLGQAYVEVRGDLSHLPSDLHGGIPHALRGVAEKFSFAGVGGGLAEMGAGFAAAYAPVALLEKALEGYREHARAGMEAATELDVAQRRLAAAVQSTGMAAGFGSQEMMEYAEQLENSTGVARSSIIEFQQRLMSFQSVTGEQFRRATKAALDWSVMMGMDMPAAARMLGIALESPVRGADRLRRAGIVLTEQQKAQIKAFVEANQMAKAQGVILDALEAKFAGAGEKLATPIKKLKAAIHDAEIELGKSLMQREPIKLAVKLEVIGFEKQLSESFNAFLQASGYEVGPGATNEGKLKEARRFGSDLSEGAGMGMSALGQATGLTALQEVIGSFFGGQKKDYDALRDANKERMRLEEEQKKIDERRAAAKRKPAGAAPEKVDKDLTGVFDLAALQSKVQESLLKKNDKLIELAEASNAIQEKILEGVTGGGGAEGVPVVGE